MLNDKNTKIQDDETVVETVDEDRDICEGKYMSALLCTSEILHEIWAINQCETTEWHQGTALSKLKHEGNRQRHIQTHTNILVCLHLIHVFGAQCWPLSVFQLLCVGFSVCVKLQSFTGAIRILTYLNLSLSLTRRHLHILIFYIRQGWSNIQCMKRLIKWGMIDERQNWERGVNWRCLDWVTVLNTLVEYASKKHFFHS